MLQNWVCKSYYIIVQKSNTTEGNWLLSEKKINLFSHIQPRMSCDSR